MISSLNIIRKSYQYLPVFLNSVSKFLIPAIIMPVALSWVGAEIFGMMAADFSKILTLAVLLDMGANVYGPVKYSQNKVDARSNIVASIFYLKLIASTIINLFAIILYSNNILSLDFLKMLIIYSICIVFDFGWLLIVKRQSWQLLISTFAGILCFYLMVRLLLVFFDKTDLGFLLLTLPYLFIALFTSIFATASTKGRLQFISRDILAELKYSVRPLSSQVFSAIYSNIGPILAASGGYPAVAGIWLIANRLILGVGNFATIPIRSDTETLTAEWLSSKTYLTKNFKFACSVSLLLCFVGILAMAILNSFLENFLFDNTYELSLKEWVLSALWLISPVFALLYTNILIFNNKHNELVGIVVAALIILCITLVIIPPSNLENILIGYLLGQIPGVLVLVYYFSTNKKHISEEHSVW